MFTVDDIRHLLRPLSETAPVIDTAEALLMASRLFDHYPLDVEIVKARLAAGKKVAKIKPLAGRDFPQAHAWNRMVDGGEVTEEVIEIFQATSRHDFGKALGREIMKFCVGEDGIEVDMVGLRAHLPDCYSSLLCCLTVPDVDPLEAGDRVLSLRKFSDKNNASLQGADLMSIRIQGWSQMGLAVRRQGLGWETAEYIEGLRKRKPVEQLELHRFIGSRKPVVINEDDFGPAESRMIDQTIKGLQEHRKTMSHYPDFDQGQRPIGGGFREVELEGYDDYRFIAAAGPVRVPTLIILDAASRDVVGGCVNGTPWVSPEHRGRGLGKAFHIADRQEALGLMFPSHFSRSGYEARCAYHRDAVLAAHAAGRKIHPENLERYAELLQSDTQNNPCPM
ncbi:hypothetical protein KUV57_12340 [Epibacterium sp. DP7N7-1]|nr:hypothetical protein [Epibacterium sp. DP7N7-1]